MNIILIILLVIGILIAFLLFLALITNGAYSIERDIIIDRPRQQVFDYIKLVKNQEQYSYWVMHDPTNKIEYIGTDGTVGFLSKWQGEKSAGKGEQEITNIDEGNSTNIEVRFEKPFKNIATVDMFTKSIDANKTQVTWRMTGRNKFPMTLFNLVIDNVLGKDMSKSLTNLKQILHQQA
jgi:uncharacterized protein YndB with AHSA1/START domain